MSKAIEPKEPCKACGGSGKADWPICKKCGGKIRPDEVNFFCNICGKTTVQHITFISKWEKKCIYCMNKDIEPCPSCQPSDLAAEVREFIEFHGRQLKLWEEVEFCRCFSPSLKKACDLLDRLLAENAALRANRDRLQGYLKEANDRLAEQAGQIKDLLEGKK